MERGREGEREIERERERGREREGLIMRDRGGNGKIGRWGCE